MFFHLVKLLCWLSLGFVVDVAIDFLSIVERLPTLIIVCMAIFIFEIIMEKTGGNHKLARLLEDH